MSQSPTSPKVLDSARDYFRNWDALGLMIARGGSFSGDERNCVFLNTGGPRFADVSAAIGLDLNDDGRAVAVTDWDHDGDLDLWIANRTAPRLRLLRNDLPHADRSIAVRLEGRRCNRDAIGARVEIYLEGKQPRRLIETLRAGDGFLSQSSKWMHFGIGQHAQVAKLRVRWPGESQWEEFTNIDTGGRYQVTQGTGLAARVESRRTAVDLQPSPPQLRNSSDQARVVLTHPVTLPTLNYLDFDRNQTAWPSDHAGPVFVNLWASWCRPCLDELRELSEHRVALEKAGLLIIALCTDDLDASASAGLTAARQFLDATKFPFHAGLATPDLLRQLASAHSRVLYKERPFPLPCSFLLDRQGKWAVLYRGAVSVEQLLSDLELLDASQQQIDAEALPLEGRFVYRGPGLNPLAIVAAYREGGYLTEARQELQKLLGRIQESNSPATDTTQMPSRAARTTVYRTLATLETELGRPAEAAEAWREAVRLDPDSASLRVGYALALARQGKQDQAKQEIKRAVKQAPDDPSTRQLVGKAWLQLGSTASAVEQLEQALKLDHDNTSIRFDLAVALQLHGNLASAIQHYKAVLSSHETPWSSRAANNLAWLYATEADPDVRDGQQAVKLAEQACQLSQQRNPTYLGTLGSAYAEAGRFTEAIATTSRALRLANGSGADELADSLRQRLLLYRKGQPYHQPRRSH